MIGSIILGLIGIVLVVLGYLIWKKEKISLLHDYHYDKVSKEDKKAFCTLCCWLCGGFDNANLCRDQI